MPRKSPLEPIPSDWLPKGVDPAKSRIAGADEVGRGALVGPLVLAACVVAVGFCGAEMSLFMARGLVETRQHDAALRQPADGAQQARSGGHRAG